MKNFLTTHLYIALNAIIFAVLLIVGGWYMHYTNDHLVRTIKTHIDHSLKTLSELATLTDGNSANEFVLGILSDCPRREDFEAHLTRLGTQNMKELLATQQLFESCGSFYAERKALMVSELEHEFQKIVLDLEYLKKLRDLKPEENEYLRWGELVRLERERSSFLMEQTKLQADIIHLLITGNSASVVQERVRQAQNIAESLTVTDAQIDALRTDLTK